MSLEMVPAKVGADSRASNEPWATSPEQGMHAGIHSNAASGNHPPGTVTLTMSVEILTNPILTKSTNEGGKGREGQKTDITGRFAARNKLHLTQQKPTTYAIWETLYVTSRRMILWPPLTSIGLILT